MFAAIVAISQAKRVRLVSDSAYVLRILDSLVSGTPVAKFQRAVNFDLITQLSIALRGRTRQEVSWLKIDSHQDVFGSFPAVDHYHILGNHVADLDAKRQYTKIGHEVTDVVEAMAHSEQEWSSRFFEYCQYLCRITKRISSQTKPWLQQVEPVQENNEHVQFLDSWHPSVEVVYFDFDQPEGFESTFVYGERYMLALFMWLRKLAWPVEASSEDIGITWLELFVDFSISTGVRFPTLTGQYMGCPVFQRQGPAALLTENPLIDKIKHFRSSIKAVCYRNNSDVVPLKYAVHKCRSLMRFDGGKVGTGFSVRPVLVCQSRTIAAIEKFHQQGRSISGYGSKLQTSIHLDYGSPTLDIPHVEDTLFSQRVEAWLSARYRNCAHRARVRRLGG
eukprot:Skav215686  [mRNA]  locus=scaffold278:270044:271216:+ [translate_table: standard]